MKIMESKRTASHFVCFSNVESLHNYFIMRRNVLVQLKKVSGSCLCIWVYVCVYQHNNNETEIERMDYMRIMSEFIASLRFLYYNDRVSESWYSTFSVGEQIFSVQEYERS